MRGVSRASFAGLRERLTNLVPGSVIADLTGDELFAVVRMLDAEHGLRRALSDPAKQGAEKAAVAGALLHGKVAQDTETLVAEAAAAHWASPGDFADAIELLGIEAFVMAAEFEGTLDDLEDDLFRLARTIAGRPDLRAALSGPAPDAAKRELLATLLEGKVSAQSLSLITQVLLHTRGRSPQAALDVAASVAAQRREQLVAVVRSASPLGTEQRNRLRTMLGDSYGKRVHLNVVVDPAVLGGISVQIGDELIDGTAASRLADVRRGLAG